MVRVGEVVVIGNCPRIEMVRVGEAVVIENCPRIEMVRVGMVVDLNRKPAYRLEMARARGSQSRH